MRISDWSSDVCSSDLMPKFENGDLSAVASAAERVADYFAPLIADGYDIVPLTTSCSLMLKFEWPLLNSANDRSEEHTSELQSLMRISYAVFCLKNKNQSHIHHHTLPHTIPAAAP